MLETKIIKFEKERIEEIIEESTKTIENGGLIIYPTETSYGIGADATNINAVQRIREIKGRSYDTPILIIVDSLETMGKYGIINKSVEKLVKKFMPGPLTIVVKKREDIPDVVSQKGIAFRISSHPIAFSLTRKFKKPITSTSANISGKGDCYDSKKLIDIFYGKVNLIIDYGKLPVVKPSTVIDLTNGPIVVRKGPLEEKEILKEFEKLD